LVEGVGHDQQGMFQSPCGVAWLFADGGCPQPPGPGQLAFPKADAGIAMPPPVR
jgi:hypothetical protein